MRKMSGAQRKLSDLEEQRINDRKRKHRLFIAVQEKALKQQAIKAPYFHADVMIKIFLLLPVKSLLRVSGVCKTWKRIIYSSDFVEAYNNQAQPVLIFVQSQKLVKPAPLCIKTQVRQAENFSFFPETAESTQKSSIYSLEIQDGSEGSATDLNIIASGCSDILAASDGLILLRTVGEPPSRGNRGSRDRCRNNEGEGQRYVVINPVTRKFTAFPLGTIASPVSRLPPGMEYESHGIVLSAYDGGLGYKVVHLFFDTEANIGCEVLSLNRKRWRAIDVPKSGVFKRFAHAPVSAFRALHWLPASSGRQYMVSLDAGGEVFYEKELPSIPGGQDRLVQMGGALSFISVYEVHQMDVWILKGLHETEWTRRYTVDMSPILVSSVHPELLVPLLAMEEKVIAFRGRRKLYTYDLKNDEMNEVEIEGGFRTQMLPHVNNLATWEPLEPLR